KRKVPISDKTVQFPQNRGLQPQNARFLSVTKQYKRFSTVFSPAEQRNSLTTFHLIEKNLTQSEARAACRENYTDLVTVYNDEDITALIRLTGIGSAWTGLYRNQFSVKWSNGDSVTFSNQETGDCGSLPCCSLMKADGSWDKIQCTQTKNFMCYKQGKYCLLII
uniref:C-type lectin domain-containing protein n=1 Tax=Astyanax mexicanus TaxID=7994 RepID=A0A3B1J000_ASTMX